MNKLLTVVVPVYKVEKYINKCLDSLIVPEEQMKKLEVIVVNDGTPDNSSIMAKEYEKRYPETFKVIDKENGGHGSAWNKGVELATGKYLRFLDSDDWLTNLSEFIVRLDKYDVDLVFTDLLVSNEHDSRRNRRYRCISGMKNDVVYDVASFDWQNTDNIWLGHNFTNFHMCTYRTSILKKYHPAFFEKMFYDDEILLVLPLCSANDFVYFDLTLYNYLVGRVGQSVDPNVKIRNLGFYLKIRKHMTDFYRQNMTNNVKVDKKIQAILSRKHRETVILMGLLPYKNYSSIISDFSSWISENYSEFNGGMAYSIYKKSPLIFWLLYHYVRPIWEYLKIDVLNLG